MQDDPRRAVEDAQARYAERLDVEPDADPAIRHVVIEGRRLGRLEYRGGDDWHLLYVRDGEAHDSFNDLVAPADDFDEADRHGIGWVADALARGELTEGTR